MNRCPFERKNEALVSNHNAIVSYQDRAGSFAVGFAATFSVAIYHQAPTLESIG